jgi:hypothetical protein
MLVLKFAEPKSKLESELSFANHLRPSFPLVPNDIIQSKNIIRTGLDDTFMKVDSIAKELKEYKVQDFFGIFNIAQPEMPFDEEALDVTKVLSNEEDARSIDSLDLFGSSFSEDNDPPFIYDFTQSPTEPVIFEESFTPQEGSLLPQLQVPTNPANPTRPDTISTDTMVSRMQYPFAPFPEVLSPTKDHSVPHFGTSSCSPQQQSPEADAKSLKTTLKEKKYKFIEHRPFEQKKRVCTRPLSPLTPKKVSKPDFETFKKVWSRIYRAHLPNLSPKDLHKKVQKKWDTEYGL